MDKVKASVLASELVGVELDGWRIESLIDNGKSAAVFKGRKGKDIAAVKVFDSELIERYGDQTQIARIQRELELKGKHHPNLVPIYGGGFDPGNGLHFIVMGYIDGPNLKNALPGVHREQVPRIVGEIASAAQFLEELGHCHRDIKPENIAIVDGSGKAVLLDLGVIRPISGSDLTDPEGIHAFIGTLQYSSPEFLLRQEEQSLEGWRALTFYQLGAVTHDLVMRRQLFDSFAEPYARLVNAVQHERPSFDGHHGNEDLVEIAKRCLLKKPSSRLQMVSWNDFQPKPFEAVSTARDRVGNKLETFRAQTNEMVSGASSSSGMSEVSLRANVTAQLKLAAPIARAMVNGLPPMKVTRGATPDELRITFERSTTKGMPFGLHVVLRLDVVDSEESVIRCFGKTFTEHAQMQSDPYIFENIWFEGILDNVSLIRKFHSFFFESVDWCLSSNK